MKFECIVEAETYANRPYYSGGRSNYRNYYPGNNDYRGNDQHDKSRLHKVKKDSRDRKDKRDKKHHDDD
jgi:hypothetical protein